jgi:AraC family transcriptional regulator
MRDWTQSYASYAEFYATAYPDVIDGQREIVGFGSSMRVTQPAGDWSDAPVPDLVLAIVVSGRGRFRADIGAGRFDGPLTRHAGIVVAPRTATSIQCEGPHRLGILGLSYPALVEATDGVARLPADGDFGALHARPLTDPALTVLVEQAWSAARGADPSDALLAQATVLTILSRLLRLQRAGAPVARRGGLAPWQLRRALALLDARLGGTVSLRELAAETGTSLYHFAHAFRVSMDCSPHRYFRGLKIERAQALLATSNGSIGEIAAAVGFDDPSRFARVFRRVTGMTPREFRENSRR